MAAARSADVLAGDVGGQAAGDQGKILLQGHFDPAVFADGVGICQLERFDGASQRIQRIW